MIRHFPHFKAVVPEPLCRAQEIMEKTMTKIIVTSQRPQYNTVQLALTLYGGCPIFLFIETAILREKKH